MRITQLRALNDVIDELHEAEASYPIRFHSPHEGYAVLLEEVDELKAEVWKKQPQDKAAMRKEAIQIAAMAIRFVIDLCDE